LNASQELKEIFFETKRLLSAYEEMGLDPPMLPKGALEFTKRSVPQKHKGEPSLRFDTVLYRIGCTFS